MSSEPGTDPDEARLHALYAALGVRDLPAALVVLTVDVDWPDARQGGRLHGREEVSTYWRRQWQGVGPRFDPVDMVRLAHGRLAVDLHYEVVEHDGSVLLEGTVRHVHRFRTVASRAWTSTSRRRAERGPSAPSGRAGAGQPSSTGSTAPTGSP